MMFVYDPRIRAAVEKWVRKWHAHPDLGYPYPLDNCLKGAHGECAAMMADYGVQEGFLKWREETLAKRRQFGRNRYCRDEYDFISRDGKKVDVKSIQPAHRKALVNKKTHENHVYEELWVVRFTDDGNNYEIAKISCKEFNSKAVDNHSGDWEMRVF